MNRAFFKEILEKMSPVYRTERRIEESLRQLVYQQQMMFWWSSAEPGETLLMTQKRVHAALPKADGALRDTQLKNFELLVRLKEICEKHDVPYRLGGGTLLGAVRHKGYIPWDDDLDIYMLRQDFNRFIKIVDHEPDIALKPYFTVYKKKAYTTFKLVWRKEGIPYWVDIFPFDYIDAVNVQQAREIWENIKRIRNKQDNALRKQADRLTRLYYEEPIAHPLDRDRIERTYAHYRNRIPLFEHGAYIYQGIDTIHADYLACYPIEQLFPFSAVEFEGIKFNAPSDAEHWLRISYGDYWFFPRHLAPTHQELLLADKA